MMSQFSEAAQVTLKSAQHVALMCESTHILPIHLLFGLATNADETLKKVLARMGADEPGKLVEVTARSLGLKEQQLEQQSPDAQGSPPYADISNAILDDACRIAARSDEVVGTGYLLLAICRCNDTEVRSVLEQGSIPFDQLNQSIQNAFGFPEEINPDYSPLVFSMNGRTIA